MPDSYQDGVGLWRCLTCMKLQPCDCAYHAHRPFVAEEQQPMAKRSNATAAVRPRRRARQGVLPGAESVRSEKLDALCESIGDERDTMNKARVETQTLIAAALEVMTKKNLTVYRHDKIELARIPGADKLRVRVTKEEGDADDTDNDAGLTGLGDRGPMAGVRLRDGVKAEH